MRPIVPTIKRFKYSDLSALEQPATPVLVLSEFDGLEAAIAAFTAEESLESQPLPLSLAELLTEGMTACKAGNYAQAVKCLEEYCQDCLDYNKKDYIEAQMWVVYLHWFCLRRAVKSTNNALTGQ